MTPRRLLIVLALVPLAGLPALAATFTDATGEQATWANGLARRGVLPPAWGSTLAPYAPIYRYEEAWMLASLLEPRDHPFTVIAWPDVPPGYWSLQAVNQVVGVGILHDENGRFNGDREITRGEFVEALDRVLSYRAIPPPPPRHGEISFPDVRGAQGQAIERAANSWQFVRSAARFRPAEILTRGEAVAMLARAAPLVDPTFAALLTLAATPTPIPLPSVEILPESTPPGSDPGPAPRTSPTPAAGAATPTPAQPTTAAAPASEQTQPPIAWRWQAAPVLASLGVADATILAANPAAGYPGGFDLDLSGASGPVVATFRAGTHLLLSGGTGLYQVFGSGEGLWMMNLAPGTDAGIGGGVTVNSQAVAGSNTAAPAANRTFFGVGPAGLLRYGLGFATLDLALQLQAGGVSSTTGGGGLGLGYQVQAHGPIGLGDLELAAGIRGQLVDPGSGAYDFVSGLVAGLGGSF